MEWNILQRYLVCIWQWHLRNKQADWVDMSNWKHCHLSLKKFIFWYFSRPTCHTCSFLNPDSSLAINTPSCLV
jgi:hypothetical protein